MFGEEQRRRRLGTGEKVRVVYNPVSGGAAGHTVGDLRQQLRDLRPELAITGDRGDAYEAARSWWHGLIVVAGGDGRVNEVVNGLGDAGFPEEVTLVVLPLGTGNDLAATLGMPPAPETVPLLLWACGWGKRRRTRRPRAYRRACGAIARSGRASRARAREWSASPLTIRSLRRRMDPDFGCSFATIAASVTMSSAHDL